MSVNAYGMPAGLQVPVATDFRVNQTASSRYRYRQVWQEGGSGSSGFGATSSTVDVNFRFGAGYVINLAQSRVRIQEQYQNAGQMSTTGTDTAKFQACGTYSFVRAIPPVRGVRLQTSAGVILIDYNRLDIIHTFISPFLMKRSELANCARAVAGADKDVLTMPLQGPNYQDAAVLSGRAYTEPGGPFFVSKASTAAMNPWLVATGNGYAASTTHRFVPAPEEPFIQQFIRETSTSISAGVSANDSASAPTIAATAYTIGNGITVQWDIPLWKFLPHSIASILQDLYFGTDLMMTLQFEATDWRGFVLPAGVVNSFALTSVAMTNEEQKCVPYTSTYTDYGSALGPDTCANAYKAQVPKLTPCTGGTVAAGQDFGYPYKMYLLLATQDNMDLVNSVKQEIGTKGLRIPAQQLFMIQDSSVPVNQSGVPWQKTARLAISRGATVLKVYCGISRTWANDAIVGTTTNTYRIPHIQDMFTNLFDTTWSKCQTFLNATPQSDAPQSSLEQWQRTKHLFSDSIVANFLAWQMLGGVIVEDYTSGFDLTKGTPEGGLSLVNPLDYMFNITTGRVPGAGGQPGVAPSTATAWIAFVMLKYLSISPVGVAFESM